MALYPDSLYDFPNVSAYDSDLREVLTMLRGLTHEMRDFTVVNKITNAGAWDITRQYKPWTIVSDNNIGYISVRPVPAGIEITNTDYWALVADYDILITNLSERISALEFNNKKYVLIGDSYGENYTTPDQINVVGWVDQFISIMGLTQFNITPNHIYRVSGSGFLGAQSTRGWLNYINSLSTDESITDIIIIGGANDIEWSDPNNHAALNAAIDETLAAAKSKFPSARIHLGYAAQLVGDSSLALSNKFKECQILYNERGALNGCSIIKNLNTALYNLAYMVNNNHPNSEGTRALAGIISSHMKGGSITNGVALTLNENTSPRIILGNASYTATDNVITFEIERDRANNGHMIDIGFPAGTTYNPDGQHSISLAYLEDLPIDKHSMFILHDGTCYAEYNGTLTLMTYTLIYWKGYMMILPQYLPAEGWRPAGTITQLYIPPFRCVIDGSAARVDG